MQIRAISTDWMRALRREILDSTDGTSADKRSANAASAALLCRRTFAHEANDESSHLSDEHIAIFLEAAILLKETLPDKVKDMPPILKQRYVNDVQLLCLLENRLVKALTSTTVLETTLATIWPKPPDSPPRRFEPWERLPYPRASWITSSTIASKEEMAQSVHFHILDGTLLINGMHLGKLPDQFLQTEGFREVFGMEKVFWIWPSMLPGMIYMAASLLDRHEIHFGLRGNEIIIRVVARGISGGIVMIYEHIPRNVFLAAQAAPDLPLPLVTGHVHFLEVNTNILEVRPQSTMWQQKLSNWHINLTSRLAWRRTSHLVDPRSALFSVIAAVLEPFESRNRLVVWQSEKGNVIVHLPVLELTFSVNAQGLLQSHQLKAVIDWNQDVGTLYGFNSKLVLQDINNTEERSVLVTHGIPKVQRSSEGHIIGKLTFPRLQNAITNILIASMLEPTFYCRLKVNKILRRLDHPAVSAVLYLKAYLHAITSGLLPDPLTGRTGVEEAKALLTSGAAQPWQPLGGLPLRMLGWINVLSPQRTWQYDLRSLQRVTWSPQMPLHVQDSAFNVIATDIVAQSVNLGHFNVPSIESANLPLRGSSHLQSRHQMRYCGAQEGAQKTPVKDEEYISQVGRSCASYTNEYRIAI